MEVGTRVWVKDPQTVWAPAIVVDSSQDGIVQVQISNGQVIASKYHGEREDTINDICIRNKARDYAKLSCLIGLEHLHEAALLHALEERYKTDHIYTSIGDILIAVNPFKPVNLYTPEKIQDYKAVMDASIQMNEGYVASSSTVSPSTANNTENSLPPHVFAIAGRAFGGLFKKERRNQSILVSGESGAGKTEATKFLMKFLTAVGTARAKRRQSMDNTIIDESENVVEIGKRILQTNPILESFGNAQTIRNDNSSRFGKFIKIQFNEQNEIVGAEILSYLLEKVRLIHQSQQERNFHIFYELLEGGDDDMLSKLQLQRGGSYELLNHYGAKASGRDRSPARARFSKQYAERFQMTVSAFQDTGISKDEEWMIFQVLAALLHLGNVAFSSLVRKESKDSVTTQNGGNGESDLNNAAKQLGVDVNGLKNLLTSRQIVAGQEVLKIKLNSEQSKDACKSLAQAIYGRMFVWLVKRLSDGINFEDNEEDDVDLPSYYAPPINTSKLSTIAILDIFGFESLLENGFEQLCINYANERLQDQFNEFVFIKEQEVYKLEGIDWSTIPYPSNEACLNLFDDKRSGLFTLLDQECLIPKGSNNALATKYYRNHGERDSEEAPRPKPKTMNRLLSSMSSFTMVPRIDDSHKNGRLPPPNPPAEQQTLTNGNRRVFTATHMHRVEFKFVVHHFAGDVCYGLANFMEKNQDSLPAETYALLQSSSNDVVYAIGDRSHGRQSTNIATTTPHGQRRQSNSVLRAPSVSAEFRGQLDTLIDEIGQTEAHYIRCLKPNELKRPAVFDRVRMVEQLRSVGVLEALRIARAGYSVRLLHPMFLDMFFGVGRQLGALSNAKRSTNDPHRMSIEPEDKIMCEELVPTLINKIEESVEKQLQINSTNVSSTLVGAQVGRTMVFLKSVTFNELSRLRLELRTKSVIVIQKYIRGIPVYRNYQETKKFAAVCQRIVRGYLGRRQAHFMRLKRMEAAAHVIQRKWMIYHRELVFKDEKAATFYLRLQFSHLKLACQKQKLDRIAEQQAEAEEAARKSMEAEEKAQKHAEELAKRELLAKKRRTEPVSEPRPGHRNKDADSQSDASNSSSHGRRSSFRKRKSKSIKKKSRSSRTVVDPTANLEDEIIRLQKLLVEQKQQQVNPLSNSSSSSSYNSSSKGNRSSSGSQTQYQRSSKRQLDLTKLHEHDLGTYSASDEEGDDQVSKYLPPRRSNSSTFVHQGHRAAIPPSSDHVGALTAKLEELQFKCNYLENVVADGTIDNSLDYRGRKGSGASNSSQNRTTHVPRLVGNEYTYQHARRPSPAAYSQAVPSHPRSNELPESGSVTLDTKERDQESFTGTAPTRTSSDASGQSHANLPSNYQSPAQSSRDDAASPAHSLASMRSGYNDYPLTPSRASYDEYGHSLPPKPMPRLPRIIKWARSNKCFECEEIFTIFVRRHHCRMCGNSFCHEHSSRKLSIFGIGFDDEPVRVCDPCFEEYYNSEFTTGHEPQRLPSMISVASSQDSRFGDRYPHRRPSYYDEYSRYHQGDYPPQRNPSYYGSESSRPDVMDNIPRRRVSYYGHERSHHPVELNLPRRRISYYEQEAYRSSYRPDVMDNIPRRRPSYYGPESARAHHPMDYLPRRRPSYYEMEHNRAHMGHHVMDNVPRRRESGYGVEAQDEAMMKFSAPPLSAPANFNEYMQYHKSKAQTSHPDDTASKSSRNSSNMVKDESMLPDQVTSGRVEPQYANDNGQIDQYTISDQIEVTASQVPSKGLHQDEQLVSSYEDYLAMTEKFQMRT